MVFSAKCASPNEHFNQKMSHVRFQTYFHRSLHICHFHIIRLFAKLECVFEYHRLHDYTCSKILSCDFTELIYHYYNVRGFWVKPKSVLYIAYISAVFSCLSVSKMHPQHKTHLITFWSSFDQLSIQIPSLYQKVKWQK